MVVLMWAKVPRPRVGSLGMTVEHIAEVLNRSFGKREEDLHVDPTYLGHALAHFKSVLEGKLQWRLTKMSVTGFYTPAIGGIAEKKYGYLVLFPIGTNHFGPGASGWNHENLRSLVSVRCRSLLTWRFPKVYTEPCAASLSLVYSPRAVNALLVAKAGEPESGSRCSTAESGDTTLSSHSSSSLRISTQQEKHFAPLHKLQRIGPSPPAKSTTQFFLPQKLVPLEVKAHPLLEAEPRDALLATKVAPVGESASCIYNARQRSAGMHVAAYYAAGNMPTRLQRFEAVAAACLTCIRGYSMSWFRLST
jgi:hypothetical protein